jgi:ribosomal protein L7Ae-like RNA K-turn-binding protein
MWLSAERNVLNRAVAANMFARAARMRVKVAANLVDQVERLLAGRALDCLGLARRAGQVAMGFDQVRAYLRSSSAAVLVAAADSAADGRRKLHRLAPGLPVITAFSRAELGAALGRSAAVHVAVAPGGLARRLIGDVQRLAGFRSDVLALPSDGMARVATELEDTTERP